MKYAAYTLWFLISLFVFGMVRELSRALMPEQSPILVGLTCGLIGYVFWIIRSHYSKKEKNLISAQRAQTTSSTSDAARVGHHQGTTQEIKHDDVTGTSEKAVIDKPATLARPDSSTKWAGTQIIKFMGLFIFCSLAIAVIYLCYQYYEETQRERAELAKDQIELGYATLGVPVEYKWHQKDHRIQIDSSASFLRKVYLKENYAIYAWKDDDYALVVEVAFRAECEPGSVIETKEKYSNGNPMKLTCYETGDELTVRSYWSGGNTNFVWEKDFGGFVVMEDFRKWDFKKVDQKVTLSRSKGGPIRFVPKAPKEKMVALYEKMGSLPDDAARRALLESLPYEVVDKFSQYLKPGIEQ